MKKQLQNFSLGRLARLALSLCLIMVMTVGAVWAQSTISVGTNPTNSTSTSYLTTVQEFTIDGVTFKMSNYNPSTGQIRGNQNSASSNFYLYNTTALPGTLSSISITLSTESNTFVDSKTYLNTGSSSITTLAASGTNPSGASWSNLDGSYFCISMAKGGTFGTCKISGITITYTTASSEDPSISADNVEFPYNAFSGSIAFTINNPVADGELTASVAQNVDWISNVQVSNETPTGAPEVTFSLSENTSIVAREGVVTLTYTYNTDQTVTKNVTVTQTGNPNGAGSENNPYTVAQARAAIDANAGVTGVYAKGVVSAIPTEWSTDYNNITFNFVDATGDEIFLQAFRCGSGDGVDASTVVVGDTVVVYGNLIKYQTTYEFAQGCQLVSLAHSSVPYIEADNVTLTADTTSGTIHFDIINPVNGGTINVSYSSTGWITSPSISPAPNGGYDLSFTTTANTSTTPRQGSFTITYTYNTDQTVSKTVTVTQEGMPIPHYTWDLSTNSYDSASDDQVQWTSNFATMTVDKANASTSANNYLGGDANNRTSSRFYGGSQLTIAPETGYMIDSVVFTATSTNYSATLANSTWTNDTATANGLKVIVVPTNGNAAISAVVGGTCGFTAVTVYYEVDNTPSLTANNVSIPADATLGRISYTLNNPVAGSFYASVAQTENFITGLSFDTQNNLLVFNCNANEATTERTATVTIMFIYNNTEDTASAVVTVTQEGNTSEPFITVYPATLQVDAGEHDGTLTLTYGNIDVSDMTDFAVQFCDANGDAIPAEPDWIEVVVAEEDPQIGEGYVVSYFMLENEGVARAAYFKVWALGNEDIVYSNIVSVIQAEASVIQPSITVADTVNIAYNATSGSFGYTINNPVPGVAMSVDCISSWITSINVTATEISFVCTANDGAERAATITLSYPYGETPATDTVTIIQAAAPAAPDVWVKTDLANLTSEDVFVIVGSDFESTYALPHNDGTSSSPDAVAVTIANDTIISTVAGDIQWTLSGNATNGYTFYPVNSTESWLCCTTTASSSNNNNIRVGTGARKVFELNSDSYLVTKDEYVVRYLSIYNSQDWRGYINDELCPEISFYKKAVEEPTTPNIVAEDVNIDFNAITGSIQYTINNLVEGYLHTSSEGWITNLSINATNNEITFTCPANESSVDRTATVTIKFVYNGTEDTVSKVVTVTQYGKAVLSTMDEIYAKAQEIGTSERAVEINFDGWIVTGANEYFAFVTDSTKGFYIQSVYLGNQTTIPHGFVAGNTLTGTAVCKLDLNGNYSARLSEINANTPGLTVGNGTPTVVNIPLSELSGINTGALVSYTGLTYNSYMLGDGNNEIRPVFNIYEETENYSFVAGTRYNVTGVIWGYGNSKEIMPRSEADIEVYTAPVTYTVTFDAGEGVFVGNNDFAATSNTVEEGTYTLPSATRDGYTFDGWMLAGNTAPVNGEYQVHSDLDFTAQYTENGSGSITDFYYDFTSTDDFYTTMGGSTHPGAGSNSPVSEFYHVSGDKFTASGAAHYFGALNSPYFMLGKTGALLNLPTFTDSKITTIKVHSSSSCSQSVQVAIYSGETVVAAAQTWATRDADYTYSIPASYQSSALSIKVMNNYNSQISGITLTKESLGDVPTITVADATVSVDADEHEGTLDLSYNNLTITDMSDFAVLFCDANGDAIPAEPDWIEVEVAEQDPQIGEGYVVSYFMLENEGAARTAYFKVWALGDEDYVYSNIVTINQAAAPLNNIPDIYAAATTTEQNVMVSFESWIVSAVSTNGKNVFVTDGINGFVMYYNTDMSGTFAANDLIGSENAVECRLKLYNGFAELINVPTTDLHLLSDVVEADTAFIDMASLSGVNTGALVSYQNLTCSVSDNKYYLTDGITTIQVYNSLYSDAYSTLVDGNVYNITGVYQQYNDTKEILPRSASDVVEAEIPLSCDGIIALPYTRDFEESVPASAPTPKTRIAPQCVTIAQEYVTMADSTRPQLYYGYNHTENGNYSMYLRDRGIFTLPQYVVINPNNLDNKPVKMRFYLTQTKCKHQLQIGVMTDLEDESTFTAVATLDNGCSSAMQLYDVELAANNEALFGKYIAFKNIINPSYASENRSYNWIDDIEIYFGEAQAEIVCEIDHAYNETFEDITTNTSVSTGVQPECWSKGGESTSPSLQDPQLSYGSNGNGSYSLYMSGKCTYVMPQYVDADLALNTQVMNLTVRQKKYIHQLEVGVMTDPTNESTFELVAVINNGNVTTPKACTVDFSQYTGQGSYIAFRNMVVSGSSSTYSYNWIDDISFSTKVEESCGIEIRYEENFDDFTTVTTALTGEQPSCWTLIDGASLSANQQPQVYYNSSYASSGNYSLYMSNQSMYVMPEIISEVNVSDLKMTLSVRQRKYVHQLEVGVMTDPTDASTFELVKVINNGDYTQPKANEVDFSEYTGQGKYIAFRNSVMPGYTSTYSYNWIDDIVIDLATNFPTATTETLVETVETEDAELDSNDESNEEPFNAPNAINSISVEQLSLYPNPTSGKLNIVADEVSMVEVYSQIGSKVATFTLNNEHVIDLGNLPKGVYILRVTMPEGVAVRKVVRN